MGRLTTRSTLRSKRRNVDNGYWIQDAVGKPGTLHRQLGIRKNTRIPTPLLEAIVDTPIGATAKNPTKVGRRKYTVTRLLKSRCNLALTLRGFKREKPPKRSVRRARSNLHQTSREVLGDVVALNVARAGLEMI